MKWSVTYTENDLQNKESIAPSLNDSVCREITIGE
jgi:hypothetical protein